MEVSAPSGTLEPPQPLPDYVRPSNTRIWQLRYQMKAGLAQPLNKHEKYYVELHRYHVLAGKISSLPSMLKPHQQHRLAIGGPETEEPLEPIVFPSFHPVGPAEQRRLLEQPAARHEPPSEALMSPSFISAVASRAAQLLRIHRPQPRIVEVKEEVDEDFSYYRPTLVTPISSLTP